MVSNLLYIYKFFKKTLKIKIYDYSVLIKIPKIPKNQFCYC